MNELEIQTSDRSIKKVTLYIKGMTCPNCEKRIDAALRKIDGVVAADVDYKKNRAVVSFNSQKTSLPFLNAAVRAEGYKIVDRAQSVWVSAAICAIILLSFVILEKTGLLNLLSFGGTAESGASYGALFVLGLITSVHCIAMCGGINLSQSLPASSQSGESENKSAETDDKETARTETESQPKKRKVFLSTFLYNTGRVLSYTAGGAILGAIGGLTGMTDGAVSIILQGVIKIAAGVAMVVTGLNMLGVFPFLRALSLRLPHFKNRAKAPFVVGLLNGFMPCGPLQSVQLIALASGNFVTGALSMLFFSLGTVPLMLGFGSAVAALGKKYAAAITRVGALIVCVTGLLMLSQGGALTGFFGTRTLVVAVAALFLAALAWCLYSLKTIYKSLITVGVIGAATVALIFIPSSAAGGKIDYSVMDGDVQVVESTLSSGEYPTICVTAGIPVRWIIHAPEGSVNGCNYKIISSSFGIEYSFHTGENVIEFTPEQAGTFDYSCWMGMIKSSIIVNEKE